ncbi:MAG: hypothetical protein HY791_11095 [Deltaproteobacteria bacterium]|nr:hypothetical protein [Deltaproteobacteria bacterium]
MRFLDGKRLEVRDDRLLVFEPTRVLALRAWPDPGIWTGPDLDRCSLPCHLRLGLSEIEELAHGGDEEVAGPCARLLAPIPETVRATLERLPEHTWRLLRLVWEEPSAVDLVSTNLALAFAIACRADLKTRLEGASWLSASELLSMKRKKAAAWLEFPPNEGSVRALARLTPEATHLRGILRLRTLLASPEPRVQKKLTHTYRINAEVLEIISDAELEPLVTPRLLDQLSEIRSSGTHVADRIRRVRHEYQELVASRRGGTFPVLTSLDDLVGLASEAGLVAKKEEALRSRNDPRLAFPPPPVPGADHIEPLDDLEDLIDEGIAQENCAGDYAVFVRTGRLYVYRVLEPERCTLSIAGLGGVWRVDQLRRRRNLLPESPATRRVIERWLKDHAQRRVPVPSPNEGSIATETRLPSPVAHSKARRSAPRPERLSSDEMLLRKDLRFEAGRLWIFDRTRNLSLRAWPDPEISVHVDGRAHATSLRLGLTSIKEVADGADPRRAEACLQLLESIPERIRRPVVPFRELAWPVLRLVHEAPNALSLLAANPALGFALACRAHLPASTAPSGDVRALLELPPHELAALLGFSPKASRLFQRLVPPSVSLANLRRLDELAKTEGRLQLLLDRVPRINDDVLEILSNETISRLVDPAFLDDVALIEDSGPPVAGRILEAIRDATIAEPNASLPVLRTLRDLERWIDRLEVDLARASPRLLDASSLDFPPPPFPGDGNIEPLSSFSALVSAAEAGQIRWAQVQGGSVVAGLSYVYRMTYPGYRLLILYQHEGRWRLTQLLGQGHDRGSPPTRKEAKAIKPWLRQHRIGDAVFDGPMTRW